jgi:hypothetical protein
LTLVKVSQGFITASGMCGGRPDVTMLAIKHSMGEN